jgi:hypothetical protein
MWHNLGGQYLDATWLNLGGQYLNATWLNLGSHYLNATWHLPSQIGVWPIKKSFDYYIDQLKWLGKNANVSLIKKYMT